MTQQKNIIIYTDGGCDPNPGCGGYGVVLLYGPHRKELSAGYRLTTNNRMEIMATIRGLEALKEPCNVTIYSDSSYVVNAIQKGWMANWKSSGWRKKNKMVLNHDLWKQLDALCQVHHVDFIWVKGHADIQENERCDELATLALQSENLLVDDAYEAISDIDPALIKKHKNPARRIGGASDKSHIKITQEGQPCRKCATPVVRKTPKKKPKSTQSYYFEYYYHCPGCQTMYMVEEAKISVNTLSLF